VEKHLTVLGILHVVFSALGLCAAAVVFLAVAGGSLLSGDQTAMSIGVGVGTLVAGFIAGVSVPGLIAGVGILKHKPWSRILMLIVGVLHLINIPFGTILGGYTIWVLVQDDSIRLLSAPPQSVTI
jgi:hypothetical protein